jgi:hypothetical protein
MDTFARRLHDGIMSSLGLAVQRSFRGYYYANFILNRIGRDHGVGIRKKFILVMKIRKNLRSIHGGTSFAQHLVLAEELLKMPKSVAGDVVECGSWRGTSAATLSLVCALVGRKLYVWIPLKVCPNREPRRKDTIFMPGAGISIMYGKKGNMPLIWQQ